MKLRKIFVTVAMLGTMGLAPAATLTFDMGAPFPASGQYTVGAVTMAVSGWSLAQPISGSTSFVSRPVVSYGGYLGVTSPGDIIGGQVQNSQHAVDNAGGYTEFVLFQFDKPVDPTTLNVEQFNSDSDVDYWTGNLVPGTLAGFSYSDLAALASGTDTNSGSRSITLTSGLVTSLIVAADTIGVNDFFKINYLKVDYNTPPPPPPPGVPEPATYATMGGALVGLALLVARRRKASR